MKKLTSIIKIRTAALLILLCLPLAANAIDLFDDYGSDTSTSSGENKVYTPKEKSTEVFTTAPTGPTGYENGRPYVDLGLQKKWAYYNIGATSPSEYGSNFQWGYTKAKKEADKKEEYNKRMAGKNFAKGLPQDMDAAHAQWGGSWCMPTQEDIDNMNKHCTFKEGTYKGIYGVMITGPNGNTLFLPSWSLFEPTSDTKCPYIRYWSGDVDFDFDEYDEDDEGTYLPVTFGMSSTATNSFISPMDEGWLPLPIRAVCASTTSKSTSTNSSSSSTYSSSTYAQYNGHSSYHRKFNENLNPENIGLTFGYVQKDYLYEKEGTTQNYGMFDNQKHLNGVHAGFTFDPQIGAGFGVHTGILYEYYWANSDEYYDNEGYLVKNNYEEHNIYVPLHLKYNFNFNKYFQLGVFGGLGIDCLVDGKINWHAVDYDNEKYYSESILNGDYDQKRFNASWEIGGSLRIRNVMFDFTASHGLLNHSADEEYKVKQNKPIRIGMTIFF